MKKIVVSIVGLSMVLMMSPVQGATVEELEDQIADLLAQIEALQDQLAGTPAAACTFTRNLYPGMSGADVKCLQQYLNGAGYPVAASGAGSPGNETEYFGSLTQAAVGAWQDANGVAYGAYKGYFGPVSQAKYTAVAPAEEEEEEEEEELEGGAGSITDVNFISSLNNEEVGEGEDDVEVAGLEVEADDGSDIELTAVRLVFVHQANVGTSSNNLDRYADEVSVWLDGEEFARSDADDLSENPQGTWARTLTLDSGAIIRMGEVGDLAVAVSGVNNIDSDDEGEDWTVEVDSVRFRDAQGATITDDATGDIGATREFSFEAFAGAADIELHVSLNGDDDEINDAHVIQVDDADETDGVPVLSFIVEVEGDSDLWIDEIVVDFTTDEDDLNDVISAAQLLLEDDEVGSENITSEDAADVPVTFDDLDLTLAPGTNDFLVEVDFEAIDADLVEGTTLLAEITDDETDDWIVEDEAGEDLADGDKTGTAVGGEHGLFSVGIMVSDVTVTETKTVTCDGVCAVGEAEQAQFTFTFDVTAFGGDIFIDDTVELPGADGGHLYEAHDGTGAAVGGTLVDLITSPGTDAAGTSTWWVDEDETREFIITINYTADAAEFVQVDVTAIQWNDDDVIEGGAGNEQYDFNMGDFESDPIFLNAA